MKSTLIVILVLLLALPLISGCATRAERRGALGGAVVGAGAGQLIGGDTESTAIGAGVGAVGGSLLQRGRRDYPREPY